MVGKIEVRKPLGSCKFIWVYNIKMNLKEIRRNLSD
jgi:hypothetical protein